MVNTSLLSTLTLTSSTSTRSSTSGTGITSILWSTSLMALATRASSVEMSLVCGKSFRSVSCLNGKSIFKTCA